MFFMTLRIALLHLCLLNTLAQREIEGVMMAGGEGMPATRVSGLKDSERYIILLITRLGLANRLRSLADWHQIAILTNRTLLVSWKPTPDCNVKFTQLFEEGPKGLKFLPFAIDGERPEAAKKVESIASAEGLSYFTLNDGNMFAGERDSFVLDRKVILSDTQVVITYYDGVIVLDGTRCQQYLSMRSQFYKSLVPIADAREVVKQVRDQYFGDRLMVGVHYRAHVPEYDWEVVPPSASSDKAVPFGVGAGVEDFDRIMEGIKNAFTYANPTTGESVTNVRFFVASNSPDAKEHFISKFADTVVISGDYSRDSTDGVFFAFIEWLLLSECSLVINTYGSSFAVEAAQVHMKPIVGIWGGLTVLHSDILLPHCGHMLYMKEFTNLGVDVSYSEGTIDNRKVCNDKRTTHRLRHHIQ
jgi:hypothetical protein